MTVSAYIFSGPTLPPALIHEKLGYSLNADNELLLTGGEKISFLPPVAEGDILRLIPFRPKIIGIIDGYFGNVPAVWHKEILLAMAEGIHVLGAASMGALRAAELEAFGMEGVGAVYRAFADGLLEDDDEVTVIHGPAELGFPLLSEAMVNMRRTFDDAAAQGIVSPSEREAMMAIAKQLHYKSRNYGRVLAVAQEQGLERASLERFQEWLPQGRQDQKFLDAAALLEMIVERCGRPAPPKQVLYTFANTLPWQRAKTGDSV